MSLRYSILILLLVATSAGAQTVTHRQYLYWLRYSSQVNFTPSFNWSNEFDNRRFVNPDVGHQFIIHSRVHYQVKRWNFAGGLSLSWVYAVIPELPLSKRMAEVRPVVEISYESPAGKSFINHRLRADNRFIQDDVNESVWESSNYLMRYRYRLQWRKPLSCLDDKTPKTMLKIADEIMVNSEGNFFDQNRIYASVEFILSKKFTFEPGYIYIYQQRMRRDEFFHRHAVRLTMIHRISRY